MKDKNISTLVKMVQYIEKVFRYVNGKSYEDFINDEMLIDATIFSICQIGENVKNIDLYIQDKYSNVMWHVLKGLRNRIVHDYDGINLELIWSIIDSDLLPLKIQLLEIINNES